MSSLDAPKPSVPACTTSPLEEYATNAGQREHYDKDLARELTATLHEAGAKLVGFADMKHVEAHGYPVGISVGIPLPPHIVEGIRNAPTKEYAQAYLDINSQLNQIVTAGERLLTARGYSAYALTTQRVKQTRINHYATQLPHKTTACLAGLGWIGKSCLLVTPQYGSALRISTLLTDAPLPLSQPITNSRCASCAQCVKTCPGNALKGTLWSAGMERCDILNLDACVAHMKMVSMNLGEDLICGACIAACPYTQRYLRSEHRLS